MHLDRRVSVFFHRRAIFKTMTSNGEQGVAFFNDGARIFRLESAPLFQITWIRGQEWTMCAGLWHRQASALPAHFIHPRWQPVYHSHSAVGPRLPNTSPKQRLLLETWYYNHCHTTPDRTKRMHTQTQQNVASHFSTTVSSLLLWSLPSFCQWVCWRHHPQSWRHFDNTPANVLLPIATSDLAVRRWSVTLLLWASIVNFFSLSLICFLLQFLMESTQRLAFTQRQISTLSLQPYLTITISFTVTISTT